MSRVVLGFIGDTPVTIDVPKLVDTRALFQANSGGGKSWALRKLLEETHGRIQHLVIDTEGEFPTLREKFDYVLAAKNGGDTAADPRSAKLLAERLLELGASAVLDIYELKHDSRITFVRHFLETLIDAPKKLWHPALVVVDEAHVFCPQNGEAESAAAVIDLCTRGRKRGFAAILATQRLAKLHKDAAAELNNVLIGRTGLDVDVKRAADLLGFGKDRWRDLRELPEGHWFGFGPALSREVIAFKVGPVQTTHPKAGARLAFTAPPPTDKVRALLPKLADLPAEAEQRQRTEADLRQEVANLKRQLTAAEKRGPASAEDIQAAKEAATTIRALKGALEAAMKFVVHISAEDFFKAGGEAVDQAEVQKALDLALKNVTAAIERKLDARNKELDRLRKEAARVLIALRAAIGDDVAVEVNVRHNQPFTITPPAAPQRPARPARTGNGQAADTGLSGPEQRIVDAIAWLESIGVAEPEQAAVAFLAGYTIGGGAFNNPRGALRTKGLIAYKGEHLALTEAGRAVANYPDEALTKEELQRRVLERLPGPEQKLLREALKEYPESISNEDLARRAGYELGGGAFNNPRGRLRTLGLIDYPERGRVRARPLLFLEGA